MKLYNKRGNKNYKEKKLLKEIEVAFLEKSKTNPNLEKEVVPATNFSELQKLHKKYVGYAEADIISIDDEKQTKDQNMSKNTEEIEDVEYLEVPKSKSNDTFIDPFNREEPIVGDYVLGEDSFQKNPMSDEQAEKTVFDEPTSFAEAFDIPDDDEAQEEQQTASKPLNAAFKEPKRREAINPNFDEMSAGKQKKSTQKFAKYIVEAVSVVSEKGFVWFANKDISEAKLAEYEMADEMDLSILVTLDTGQDVTVKEFFQSQCLKAEELSQWTTEQKNDLSIALAEVLLEKGIAPTPTQELMLVAATIVGGQLMTLLTLKSQTNSLLTQLRSMHEGSSREYQPTYFDPNLNPIKQESEQEVAIEDLKGGHSEEQELQHDLEYLSEEELLMSDKTIQTKE